MSEVGHHRASALDATAARTVPRGPRSGAVASNAGVQVAVLVPVLNRPERVRPLVESLAASSRFIATEALFLCSPGDKEEIRALSAVTPDVEFEFSWEIMAWEPGPGDYARKINWGARDMVKDGAEFVFLAADDLTFHPGWAERALAAHLETDACVIGTNDIANRHTASGEASTHSLVHRDYLECGTIDEPGLILHEGYSHQFVDTELVATAKARGTFVHATDAIVEHHHPMWGTAPMDSTYRRGQTGFHADRTLYNVRRRLWEAL